MGETVVPAPEHRGHQRGQELVNVHCTTATFCCWGTDLGKISLAWVQEYTDDVTPAEKRWAVKSTVTNLRYETLNKSLSLITQRNKSSSETFYYLHPIVFFSCTVISFRTSRPLYEAFISRKQHLISVLQIGPTSYNSQMMFKTQGTGKTTHCPMWFIARHLTFSLKNAMLVSKSTVDLRSDKRGLLLAGKLFWRSERQAEHHRRFEWEVHHDPRKNVSRETVQVLFVPAVIYYLATGSFTMATKHMFWSPLIPKSITIAM